MDIIFSDQYPEGAIEVKDGKQIIGHIVGNVFRSVSGRVIFNLELVSNRTDAARSIVTAYRSGRDIRLHNGEDKHRRPVTSLQVTWNRRWADTPAGAKFVPADRVSAPNNIQPASWKERWLG